MPTVALALAFISALGFGSSAIFARLGMQGIGPMTATFISAVGSFVPVVILALIFAHEYFLLLPAIAFLWFALHGALTYIGGRSQNYLAINLLGASRSSPFIGASALFGAIFAIIFLGERPHVLVLLGTVSVVGGLALSAGKFWEQEWRADRRSLLGYGLALGAAASYGGSNLVAKELGGLYGSPLVVATFGMLFGSLLLFPLGGRGALDGLKKAQGRFWWVALSGLSSAAAVVSLYFALQLADVTIVAPISASNPLVTLALAWLFLGQLEKVTLPILAGTSLTVAGVVLVVIGSGR